MADKKKTKSSATRGKNTSSRSKKAAQQQVPIRREVGAIICLFLAVFTVLCCFGVKAAFLDFMGSLFKGLIGSGFYVLPLSFLMGFLILLLHDGRPVALRVTCAFLLAVIIGALLHLLGGQINADWGFSMFKELYLDGVDGISGGMISGLLSQTLELIISRVGAGLVLTAGLILSLITSLNMTIKGIFTAIKNRPRVEYDEPQREHKDPAEVIVNRVATKHIEQMERRRAKASEFDLPVDEPPLPEKSRNTTKKGMRPDEYVEQSQREGAAAAKPQAESPKTEQAVQTAAPVQQPVHTDYKKQFDDLIAQPVKKETAAEANAVHELPKQMPPFVMPVTEHHEQPVVHHEQPQVLDEKMPAAEHSQSESVKKEDVQQEAALIEQEISQEPAKPEYQFPPVELLHAGSGTMADGTNEMRQNANRLNDTLKSFGIEAHIINVTRGPSITRYELELSRGTKLSKVTNLADDLALALGASGVRIAAIPEKISVVGIEVPNRLVSTVFARDVIDSNEFNKSKSRISFAVGKDIGGSCIIGDIGKLPHMLIAGTTGSGKSVCMNSLIISLLYKAKPEDVRLIMVDPKMVELGIYNGIPHLLIPVVTDPKKAAGALQWGVTEMMRRYRLMADAGVRDLESFNKLAENSEEFEHMAQIVVVIDELADLMLVAAKEVEESICRIAQMGRAAGIHLVIATQRPSADVITGLMKANIPSRIAFAVASAMESRIILDTAGAEKLVGKGDMLYAPLGQGKPKRVQGCFITDDEVSDVVDFVKKSSTPDYSEEVLQEIDRKASESGRTSSGGTVSVSEPSSDGDEMLPAAVDVILETSQASVSMLQRRLKLGYARAARIMDEMEEKGIVGPFEGSKPRQLLITKEQWEIMKNGGSVTDNPPVEEEIP